MKFSYPTGIMYLIGQAAHTLGNIWLSHWSDENSENSEVALNKVHIYVTCSILQCLFLLKTIC